MKLSRFISLINGFLLLFAAFFYYIVWFFHMSVHSTFFLCVLTAHNEIIKSNNKKNASNKRKICETRTYFLKLALHSKIVAISISPNVDCHGFFRSSSVFQHSRALAHTFRWVLHCTRIFALQPDQKNYDSGKKGIIRWIFLALKRHGRKRRKKYESNRNEF